MLAYVISCVIMGGLIYKVLKPPAPKICGSVNGPPVTSPRIKLRDGRHLAYKIRGKERENAKYKVILCHGYSASKETWIPLSDEWLQELGICLITFDRAGYSESDPNPNRSPRNDAFDIQELADQLNLGSRFYVIALSISTYVLWGCLRYIPNRLAGAVFIGPIINLWWPSLPPEIRTVGFRKLPLVEKWRLGLFHYSPIFARIFNVCFPPPDVNSLLKKNPHALNKHDVSIFKLLANHSSDKDKITQQGTYESVHRDWAVACGAWEFDPLQLENPFPDYKGTVHLWMGLEDRVVEGDLLRYVVKRLPWIKCHQVPYGGHLFIHDHKTCQDIFKSLLLGEEPCFG